MAPLGLAEDTQGSIRVPAALCGIVGFRPTTTRYPTAGAAPIAALFDQVGPLARTVRDVGNIDGQDRHHGVRRVRAKRQKPRRFFRAMEQVSST